MAEADEARADEAEAEADLAERQARWVAGDRHAAGAAAYDASDMSPRERQAVASVKAKLAEMPAFADDFDGFDDLADDDLHPKYPAWVAAFSPAGPQPMQIRSYASTRPLSAREGRGIRGSGFRVQGWEEEGRARQPKRLARGIFANKTTVRSNPNPEP